MWYGIYSTHTQILQEKASLRYAECAEGTQKSYSETWRYRLHTQYDGGSADHLRLSETSISFTNRTYQS